ncbi:MAG TPA: M56 family metallopeptidase [Candidatus Angelobacter sp.]|jgi:Zn-dependent protease with chaperone function|nr:M56 family metallopeptidase [Candidatus Angelobacter sp.]
MFYLLCIALCLAVMVLVTAGTLFLSIPLARVIHPVLRRLPASAAANLVLLFRLFPFLLGIVVSAGLALPAFLEFEPRTTHEMLDWPLLLLAASGVLVCCVLLVRAGCLMLSTRRWLRERKSAQQLPSSFPHAEIYRTTDPSSLLAVTGIFRPTILVSADITDALTPRELDAAIRHELAHVRSWDNLKQFVLKVTHLPSWIRPLHDLDHAWIQSSEVAADETALATGAPPLDLSAALIKVARLAAGESNFGSVAASHLVPCECKSATATRAARLRQILESGKLPHGKKDSHPLRAAGFLLAACALYLVCLGTMLPAMHEILEILVR